MPNETIKNFDDLLIHIKTFSDPNSLAIGHGQYVNNEYSSSFVFLTLKFAISLDHILTIKKNDANFVEVISCMESYSRRIKVYGTLSDYNDFITKLEDFFKESLEEFYFPYYF